MTLFFAFLTAFYLGLLAAISPCPLTTNLMAFSYITQHAQSKKKSIFVALTYALGRSLTYALLGFLLIGGVFASTQLSHFLQKYMNLFLGPILLLVSLFLLKLIPLPPLPTFIVFNRRSKLFNTPILGAFTLGILFALSFCPTTAVLFFGSLIPLSLDSQSIFLLPLTFGVSSTLPILVLAFLTILGAHRMTNFHEKLTLIEPKLHFITALLFLVIGLYMTLTQSMQLQLF